MVGEQKRDKKTSNEAKETRDAWVRDDCGTTAQTWKPHPKQPKKKSKKRHLTAVGGGGPDKGVGLGGGYWDRGSKESL